MACSEFHLVWEGMENSPATGDGGLFSRDTSNAASDKLQIINALSAVVQSLLKSALHLNAMVEHLGNNASLEESPGEHEVETPHECHANLVEEWHIEEDEDFIAEYPSVTCLICETDFTDDFYGESPTEPDEEEMEWFE